MMTRISTSANHLITIESLQRRQSDIAQLQKNISSGVKFDTFADVAQAGVTRRVVSFTSISNQVDAFKRTNEIMKTRLETMDKALAALQEINTGAIATMVQERSAVQQDLPLAQELRARLQQIEGELNSNIDGRYLFSGAATSTRPVYDLLTTNLDGNNTPTDNYYRGDGSDLSQNVSVDVEIQFNLRANDPAFIQLIGAMNLGIKAEKTGMDNDDMLADAIDMANDAQKALTGLRNLIGNNLATLDEVNTQHDNFNTYFKTTLSNIEGTDVAEASIQLSLDQAILTASFQAFARISGLTLGQYLR